MKLKALIQMVHSQLICFLLDTSHLLLDHCNWMQDDMITETLKKICPEVINYPCKMISTLWLVLMINIKKEDELQ
jgi:hypothetical protein